MTTQNNSLLEKIKIKAIKIYENEFDDKLVYTNIELLDRILAGFEEIAKAENLDKSKWDLCKAAIWLKFLGLRDLSNFESAQSPIAFIKMCETSSLKEATKILDELGAEKESADTIKDYIKKSHPDFEPDSKASKIINDAISIDLGKPKAKKKLKLLYTQFLLTHTIRQSKASWLTFLISYLNDHKFETNYGQTTLKREKDKLIEKVDKELKEISKQEKTALKREMGISDDELKSLKKKLKSVDGRDERGIQTMFRTTSRNHYTLNQMIDRKSNIMISINSIILSLMLGRLVSIGDQICIHNFPIIILMVSSAISIVFAILAIRPAAYHGKFTIEDIRNKEGNLLYFGNYFKMNFREYNWGMLEMLNDSDYLYTSMIRDQYYLGQMLGKKYSNIRQALTVFMFGIITTLLLFLILIFFTDFHFGAGNH